jgi:hypothetical protein
MSEKLEQLKKERDEILESLPEAARRRHLAEESASQSLIETNQFTIGELLARAGDQDVLFFDVLKDQDGNIDRTILSYGVLPLSEILGDSPRMREYMGGYLDTIESTLGRSAEAGAKILLIRFRYTQEFLDYCGSGIDSLPISNLRLIPQVRN